MAVNSYGTNYSDEISFVTRPDTVTLDLATKIDNNKFNMHRNIVTGADSYNLYVSTDS
jgi:hypothetical protein